MENINRSMVINNNNDVDNRIVNNNNNSNGQTIIIMMINVIIMKPKFTQSESSSYICSPTNSRLSSPNEKKKLGIKTANF